MERNPPDETGARVLIVEDDRAQLRTLVAILRDEGFDVAGCATAGEALDRFAREPFDVGIFDLGLPDTDDGHPLDRFADVASRVSLIVYTGRGSFDSAKEAVNIGIFAYVEKGNDPRELVGHVHRAVAARLRRRARDLKEERDRILALSQDLICIAAMDGYFRYVSPSWTRVLGCPAEELLSRPFLEFIHPDDHALNDAEVARLAQGIQTVDFENRYVCKDGSIRHFLWNATPLVEPRLMYCIGRDITRENGRKNRWRVTRSGSGR
jgi:PAS domain S-box-containing protein